MLLAIDWFFFKQGEAIAGRWAKTQVGIENLAWELSHGMRRSPYKVPSLVKSIWCQYLAEWGLGALENKVERRCTEGSCSSKNDAFWLHGSFISSFNGGIWSHSMFFTLANEVWYISWHLMHYLVILGHKKKEEKTKKINHWKSTITWHNLHHYQALVVFTCNLEVVILMFDYLKFIP